MDLLYDAAVAWNQLLQYRYDIVCGKSKQLYTIVLGFETREFYHLAGFPHLKDIVLPVRTSQPKMHSKVLDRTITGQMIEKSENYEKIIRRKLEAIIRLEQLLNGCPKVYLYNRWKLDFYTNIQAKYLLVDDQTRVVFLFTDSDGKSAACFSRSAFVMDDRDFRVNQSKMTVLQIKRTNLTTGITDVLFCKEGFATGQLYFSDK